MTEAMLDDFLIEEAVAPVKAAKKAPRRGIALTGRLTTVGAKPGALNAPSAYDRAFPSLPSSAPPTCQLAFESVHFKPRWHPADECEVAFKGKGFEGSWASAVIVLNEGRNHGESCLLCHTGE